MLTYEDETSINFKKGKTLSRNFIIAIGKKLNEIYYLVIKLHKGILS